MILLNIELLPRHLPLRVKVRVRFTIVLCREIVLLEGTQRDFETAAPLRVVCGRRLERGLQHDLLSQG